MGNRDQLGKFVDGAKPGPGRPRGKTQQVRLREAKAKAIETLISAAHRGDPAACAAIVSIPCDPIN